MLGLALVLLTTTTPASPSHADEAGVPLLENLAPRDYGADAQNWDIVQDSRGLIYIANTLGVLEFDGQRWSLHKLDNESTVRSLAVDAEDRVHVGGTDEFGVLELDRYGRRHYRALHNRLPAGLRPVGEIRATHATADGVVYNALRRLIRLRGDQVQSWTPSSSFHFSFRVNQRLLIWEQGRGMLELIDDQLHPLPGADRLAELRVYAALPFDHSDDRSSLLLATRRDGLFLADQRGIRPWPTEIDSRLKEDLIYRGLRLHDGQIALGTLRGLYVLDAEGGLQLHLNRSQGLRDEDVLSLFEDRSGSVWLGLDNGLSRIDRNAPFSRFGEPQGLLGRVIALHRHQHSLYAATGRGLFRLQSGHPAGFVAVPKVNDQTWAMLSLGDRLLVGNTNGLFEVSDGQAETAIRAGRAIGSLLHKDERLFVGMDGGFQQASFDGSRWQQHDLLNDFDELVQSIHHPADDRLWLAVFPHGIVELTVEEDSDSGKPKAKVLRWYREDDGVPARTALRLLQWHERWLVLGSRPASRFDPQLGRFEPDQELSDWADQHGLVIDLLRSADDGREWFHAHRQSDGLPVTGYFRHSAEQGLSTPNYTPSLQGITVRSILPEADGLIWIGSDDGLFRFNPNDVDAAGAEFPLLLRSIRAGDHALPVHPDPLQPTELSFGQRALSLIVAIPGASASNPQRLEAKVIGAWNDWRQIQSDQQIEIDGLDAGDYQIALRAIDAQGHPASQLIYPLRVHPPWFRSWPFLALVAIGALALLIGIVQWRTRNLRSINLALEQKVQQRTSEIEQSRQRLATALEQLRSTQAELLKRERLASLGGLVAGVAHEINTPLGYTLTVTSHLQQQIDTVQQTFNSGKLTRSELRQFLLEAAEALTISIRGLQRSATLVQRFKQLAIDRPDSRSEVNLRSALQASAERLQDQLDPRGISVHIECPLELAVQCSENTLHSVLDQLLLNALQHAFPSEGGRIAMSASRDDSGRFIIVVEDNGIGMDEATVRSALEPFYTTRRHQGGVGLGLSTAHNQVAGLLGGDLQLRSSPGRGTRVELTLPAPSAEWSADPASRSDSA
ncbi:ATP-binding protein [Pseudomarimonas arenosa]|nr:ATP-binding protein [Pseudomarimonas arenosa]